MHIETLGKLLYNIDALGERSLYLIQLIIAGSWITEEPAFVYLRTYVCGNGYPPGENDNRETQDKRAKVSHVVQVQSSKRKPCIMPSR